MKIGERDVSDSEVAEVLESVSWQFAKSMPEVPHCYTMMKWWDGTEDLHFKAVAKFIKVCGTPRKWGPHRNTYFTFGEFDYWGMDKDWRDVVLINRCETGWVDPLPHVKVRPKKERKR